MKYEVILSDPPWEYASRCTWSKTKFGGGVHSHYPTMKTTAICALPIARDYADKSCALFLWVTGPHLDSGLAVMQAWGFEFKTIAFSWTKMTKDEVKPMFGPGYYTASNVELVLLGTRGPTMKPSSDSVSQVLFLPHPRGEDKKIIHSRKPNEVHRRIEKLFGERKRLELFARVPQPGWDVIGNQLEDAPVELRPLRTLDWQGRQIVMPRLLP